MKTVLGLECPFGGQKEHSKHQEYAFLESFFYYLNVLVSSNPHSMTLTMGRLVLHEIVGRSKKGMPACHFGIG